jgi:hypothetical protein
VDILFCDGSGNNCKQLVSNLVLAANKSPSGWYRYNWTVSAQQPAGTYISAPGQSSSSANYLFDISSGEVEATIKVRDSSNLTVYGKSGKFYITNP